MQGHGLGILMLTRRWTCLKNTAHHVALASARGIEIVNTKLLGTKRGSEGLVKQSSWGDPSGQGSCLVLGRVYQLCCSWPEPWWAGKDSEMSSRAPLPPGRVSGIS